MYHTNWLSSLKTARRQRREASRRRDRRVVKHRPFIEALEERCVLASFSQTGTILSLNLNVANENVSVVSTGSSYLLTLGGTVWSGTSANVTGGGTSTLTVTTAGLAALSGLSFTDSSAATGSRVTFANSGANGYTHQIDVLLDASSASTAASSGTSRFTQLTISSPIISMAGSINVSSNLTIGDGGNGNTISALVSGTGGLIKNGTGRLRLTNANTYSGGTTILGGGTIDAGVNNALPAGRALTIGALAGLSAGKFSLGSFLQSISSLTIYAQGAQNIVVDIGEGELTLGGSIRMLNTTASPGNQLGAIIASGHLGQLNLGGAVRNIIADGQNATTPELTIQASIINGGINFTGNPSVFNGVASTLQLEGFANGYGLGTTVNAGTVALESPFALGGVGQIALKGGTLRFSGNDTTDYSSRLDGSSTNFSIDTNGQSVTFASPLTGTGRLTKIGNGTLTLAGSNNYSGGTTISEGTLALGSGGAMGTTGSIVLSGGTLQFSANNTIDYSSRFGAGSTDYTIDTNGQAVSFASPITGTASLTKIGTGTLTLSAQNSYSGGTAIFGGGAITAGVANALPSGRALVIGRQGSPSNGRFNTGGFAHTLSGLTIYAQASSGSIGVDVGSGTLSLLGDISLLNTISNPGNGYGATIAASAGGTLDLGGVVRSITMAARFSALIINPVIVNGGINFTGNPGTTFDNATAVLTLGALAPNAYTQGTTVNAGTISVLGTTTLGAPSSALTINTSGSVSSTVILGSSQTIGKLESNQLNGEAVIHLNGPTVALVINQSATTVYGGSIIGTGSVIKQGVGTLSLSGSNTYTGGTTIGDGGLVLENPDALGTFGLIHLTGGTLVYSVNNTVDYSARFSSSSSNYRINTNNQSVTFATPLIGSGSLTKTGSGTLILTGDNSYTGGTGIIGSGTLQVGNGGTLGALPGDAFIGSGALLRFSFTGGKVFTGTYSGGGSIAFAGSNFAATFSMTSKSNSYTGETRVESGSLTLGVTGVIPDSSVVVLGNGTQAGFLILSSSNETIGGLANNGSGSSKVKSSTSNGTSTLTLNQSNDTIFSGQLGGSSAADNNFALVKSGSGILTLAGVNTYTGGTSIFGGGAITAAVANALPSGSVLNIGEVAHPSNGRFNTGGFAHTISGLTIYAQNGSNTVVDVGAGTLTLLGNINLQDTIAGAGNAGGATIAAGSDGKLDLGGAVRSITVAAQNLSSDLTVNAIVTGGGISFTGSPSSFNGVSAKMTLGSSAANTYTQGTTINSGTLIVASTTTLGAASGALTFNTSGTVVSSLVLNASQTLASLQTNGPGTSPASIGLSSSTVALTVNQSIDTVYVGTIVGSGTLTKSGPGKLTLIGASNYAGGTTISSGTLQVGAAGVSGAIAGNVVNNGILEFSRSDATTFFGVISGTGVLVKNGGGSLTLTAANTYIGGTLIGAGSILQIGVGTSSGSILGDVVNNGSLQFNRSDAVTFGGVINGTGGLVKNGGGILTLTAANTYSGGTTISAGTLQIGNGGISGAISGNLLNNGSLQFNRSDAMTFGGVISGAGSLLKNGTGTLTLAAVNTYSGGTTILGGGAITAGIANALPSGSALTIGQLASPSNGRFNTGGFAHTLSGLTIYAQLGSSTSTGNTVVDIGDGTLTLSGDIRLLNTIALAGDAFGAIIAASGGGELDLGGAVRNITLAAQNVSSDLTINAIVKGGGISFTGNPNANAVPARLTLAALVPSTYTQGTTVNAGTLIVNGTTTLGASTGALALNTTNSVASRVVLNGSQVIGSLQTNSIAGPAAITLNGFITLTVNQTIDTSFDGVIEGSGSIAKLGSGRLTLLGGNAYSGGTTIGTGSNLQIGNGGTSGNILGNVINNGSLQFNRSDAMTFGGVISGSGSLLKNGTGTLTLTSSNTYAGGTTILGGGAITAGIANALPGGGALTIGQLASPSNGRFNTGGFAHTVAGLNIYAQASANTVVDIGAGTLTLSGDIRLLDTVSNAGNAFGVTIAASASGKLDLGGGVRNITLAAQNVGSDLTINAIIFGGGINFSGNPSTTNSATAKMVLGASAPNTYSLGTTVNAGAIVVLNTTTLGANSGSLTLNTTGPIASKVELNRSQAVTGLQTSTLGTGAATINLNGQTVALTIIQPVDASFAGNIIGNGSIFKQGPGKLTLNGSNTFPSGVAIGSGTLSLGNSAALGTEGPIDITGGILQYSGNNNRDYTSRFTAAGGSNYRIDTNGQSVNFASVLPGAGILTKIGNGTLTLNGTNSFTGGTNIIGGTLALGSAGAVGTSGLITLSGGTLQYSAANTADYSSRFNPNSTDYRVDTNGQLVTFASAISGAASLTKIGEGTLTLAAANTFTGGTTIFGGGDISAGVANALPSGTALTIGQLASPSNGRFKTNGFAHSISALDIYAQNGIFDEQNGTVLENTVVDIGDGTLTLSGDIRLLNTILESGNGQGANITAGASGKLDLGGAVRNITVSGQNVSSDLAINAIVIGGGINFTGNPSTANNRAASFTLGASSPNTLALGTTVNAGRLIVAETTTLGAITGALTLNTTGSVESTVLLNGSQTISSLKTNSLGSGLATINLVGQTTALSVSQSSDTNYGGTITGSGKLIKQAGGTLTLSGTNEYTGGTTIDGGTLALGSSGAIGTTGSIVFSGGTLQYSASNNADYSSRFDPSSTNYRIDTNGRSVTLANTISGSGRLNKSGTGSLTLSGNNTYTGITSIFNGPLVLNSPGAFGTTGGISLSGGTLQYSANNTTDYSSRFLESSTTYRIDTNGQSVTFATPLKGTGRLVKNGAGTLTLAAANTFSGGTTIGPGSVLQIGDGNTSGSIIGDVVTSGTLQFNHSSGIVFDGAISGSGNLVKNGVGTLSLTGTSSFTGGTTIGTDSVLQIGNGTTTGTLTGNVANSGSLQFNRSNSLDFAGVISGNGRIVQNGVGTTTLTGNNSFTGGTTISAGTLSLGSAGAVASTGLITLSGGTLQYSQSNNTDYSGRFDLFSTDYRIDTNGQAITFASPLIGVASLTKLGTNVLTLVGTSGYTAATVITGGTLALSGSSSNNVSTSSSIQVQSGGALDVSGLDNSTLVLMPLQSLSGRGTVTGSTNAGSGSHIAPGSSPGVLNTGHVTLANGSTLDVELDGTTPGTEHDQLNVAGTVNVSGSTLNLILGFTTPPSNVFTIINNDGADPVVGTFSGLLEGQVFNVSTAAFQGIFRISYQGGDGNDVVLLALSSATVADVQTTSSTVRIAFNSPIDLTALNLYDGVDASVDVPDLTLIGATSGLVRGSAIWNATDRTLTFIKTGGPLGSDTYSLTLFSRPDGFQSSSGELLDGDFNGVPGGNYISSFTVAPSAARVVSFPDFARGATYTAGQVVNVSYNNGLGGIPITISNAEDVVAIALDVAFDHQQLDISSAFLQILPEDWTTSVNIISDDRIRLNMSGVTPLPAGSREVARILASVPTTAPYGATQMIRIENLQLLTGANGATPISSVADPGVHQAIFMGDTNADGVYSAQDAGWIAGAAALTGTGFDAYSLVDPVVIGDVNQNGSLDGLDASWISRKGLSAALVPEIADLPSGTIPTSPSATRTLALDQLVPATSGQMVIVPLRITDPAVGLIGIDAFIGYDTDKLDMVSGLNSGDVILSGGFAAETGWILDSYSDDTSGATRISLYRTSASSNGPSAVAQLQMQVKPTASNGITPLTLSGYANVPPFSFNQLSGSIAIGSLDLGSHNPHVSGKVLTTLSNTGIWTSPTPAATTLSASIGSVLKNFDGTWSWSYRPIAKLTNQAVTITATAGQLTSSTTFTLDAVVDITQSRVYYKGSSFSQSGTNVDAALDTAKVIARSGETSQKLNYSNLINTKQGINGLVFDVAGLAANSLTAADFVLRMSPTGLFNTASNPPSSWATAPAPLGISVTPGTETAPARVRLEWADKMIANRWLQIQVAANNQTGLATPVVYYIGHLQGEVNGLEQGSAFFVTTQDQSAVLPVGLVTVSSPRDLDKNGFVTTQDVTAVRESINAGNKLTVITIPAAGSAAEGSGASTPSANAPSAGEFGSAYGGAADLSLSGMPMTSRMELKQELKAAETDRAIEALFDI